jgi:hypothetical protein
MAAYSEFAGEVRACALYRHRTAALIARVIVLILALLLALVLTSQSRADDGADDEPMLPFTIGGGLTVAALGALVLVFRRIHDLRSEKRRLEERIEALSDHNWELKEAEERARSFLEAQGDVIVRRDGDGRITCVNDASARSPAGRARRSRAAPSRSTSSRTAARQCCRTAPAPTTRKSRPPPAPAGSHGAKWPCAAARPSERKRKASAAM